MTYHLGLDQTWRQSQGPVILISKAASIANITDVITLTCVITDSSSNELLGSRPENMRKTSGKIGEVGKR